MGRAPSKNFLPAQYLRNAIIVRGKYPDGPLAEYPLRDDLRCSAVEILNSFTGGPHHSPRRPNERIQG
jgi:hypothetical protein